MLDRHIHLQITAVARWLLIFGAKIPSTLLEKFFLGGGERRWHRSFKHFLECTYFSTLAKVIIRILQPFLCFFLSLGFNLFFSSWIFIPLLVFSLLYYSLVVTALLCSVTPPQKYASTNSNYANIFLAKISSRVNIICYQCWVRTGYFLKIAKLVGRVSCILYLPSIYLHRICIEMF